MFMKSRRLALAIALGGLLSSQAHAHFLFVRIGPLAEGGRSAEVFFSEQAEAGDPKYTAKIAMTRLFVQEASKPGEFREVKVHQGTDRLKARVPAMGEGEAISVVGECNYGVLARPNQTPFLLRYYPKAIAGAPEQIAKLKPRGQAYEVIATPKDGGLAIHLLHDGKPVPDVEFTTVDSDLNNTTFKSDAKGHALWTPPSPGRYSVYAKQTIHEKGTYDGKAYDEIRAFPTLAFSWPLDPEGPDAEAVAAFEAAVAKRAVWENFPGFSAKVEGVVDGRDFSGKVSVSADGKAKVDVEDEAARDWLKGQLESIALHRRPSPKDAPKPVLRFADPSDETHPQGRLLAFEGGQFASSYRVKDGRITVVNRNMGRTLTTITTLDEQANAEGKTLPKVYAVQVWDPQSDALRKVDTIQDRWIRIESIDLPEGRTATSNDATGVNVRSFSLSEHALKK